MTPRFDLIGMTAETTPLVAAFHRQTPHVSDAALRYEYFENPDPYGKMYYAADSDGALIATQAFIGQGLIKAGQAVPSLMSERTLLAAALRGKSGYGDFYVRAMHDSVEGARPAFVWGTTTAARALQSYGYSVLPCFATETLVYGAAPFRALLAGASSFRHKAYYSAQMALGLCRARLSLALTGPNPISIDQQPPASAELTDLVSLVSGKYPDGFFFNHTPDKLRWLVTENPFRRRQAVCLRRGERLAGLAIIEDRGDGFATLADLLVEDEALTGLHLAALAKGLAKAYGGLKYWGNWRNGYVAHIQEAMHRLGSTSGDLSQGPSYHPVRIENLARPSALRGSGLDVDLGSARLSCSEQRSANRPAPRTIRS